MGRLAWLPETADEASIVTTPSVLASLRPGRGGHPLAPAVVAAGPAHGRTADVKVSRTAPGGEGRKGGRDRARDPRSGRARGPAHPRAGPRRPPAPDAGVRRRDPHLLGHPHPRRR